MLPDNRETRAIGLAMAVVSVFGGLTLSTGLVKIPDFLELWGTYTLGAFALWYALGLGAAMIITIKGGRQAELKVGPVKLLMDHMRARWARDQLLSLVWPPLLFSTLMASFNAFKQLVLVKAGFQFDAAFASIDRALFLGNDPWRVTHALFPSTSATQFLDTLYHGWFVPMSLGVIICAWLPEATYRLRTQYLFSYLAVWIGIGSVLAILFPAAGPCFATALIDSKSSFGALMDTLHTQQFELGEGSIKALINQKMLLSVQGSGELSIGGGISAMPSVHNALAVLFALAASQMHRNFGRIMWVYALVIWIGSIHLGWHYAIDGLVSGGLTVLIWKQAGRLADWLERPRASTVNAKGLNPAT
jgi:hypothetical protein